jgi:hypothetical protein
MTESEIMDLQDIFDDIKNDAEKGRHVTTKDEMRRFLQFILQSASELQNKLANE